MWIFDKCLGGNECLDLKKDFYLVELNFLLHFRAETKKIHLSKCTFINFSGTVRSRFYSFVSKSFFYRVANFEPLFFIPKV